MDHRISPRLVLPAVITLAGCAAAHAPAPGSDDPLVYSPADPSYDPDVTVRPTPAGILGCLEGSGELVEVQSVDNNDVADHGALLTLGVSPAGEVAAAGADGTLKFWTLDAELLTTIDASLLTYGTETEGTPITDLAFTEDAAIAGDVRGLVAHVDSTGGYWPVGGTTPDIPIRSVAVHAATGRWAHAQVAPDLPEVVVRSFDAPDTVELDTAVTDIRDLAFARGGELLIAGDGTELLEIRQAADPRITVGAGGFHGTVPVLELAAARDADVVTAISDHYLYVLRDLAPAAEIRIPEHQGRSVDVTPDGAVALTVGGDGALLAIDTDAGTELARVEVPDPVTVRLDPTGTLVVVGSRDAMIHAFACVGD